MSEDASGQEAVVQALALAVATRTPVLLWGGPGTGKTSTVVALAAAMGIPVETVIASLREPADFAGLPVVAADGSVRLAEASWARRLHDAGEGLLFLDEVTTAPPAVQAALLRVVLERVVGDLALPPSVAVVAAANPPSTSTGAWDLSAPLANRFCHLDWPADPLAYAESLSAGWPLPEVPALQPARQQAAARVRGTVGGFLRSRPGLVHDLPRDPALAGRSWPSPRTWDMAVRLWSAALEVGSPHSVVATLLSGCVGPGATAELLTWEQDADLPDPEAVLADPGRFELPQRGDRRFAVLSAVAAAVAADPTAERWEAGCAVLQRALESGAADVAAVVGRALAECAPSDVAALPPAFAGLAPILSRAGLLRRARR